MSDHSKYTSSQKRPNKTEWSASIEADEGYVPGRLNKEHGILESDISIYASESMNGVLYILIDQYNHQHIKVIINDETVYENARVIKCKIGDRFYAEIVADTGYTIKGTLNSTSGIMYKSRHLSADKDAEPKMCKITLPATTNQTLTFYSMYTIQKSDNKSKSFYVTYDTEYSIEINPIYGYNKGTSNHTELTMYKLNVSNTLVNSNDFSLNITCTDATKKKYRITVPTMDNETVRVIANGTTYTSAVSLDYLTEYRITITPKDNTYVPGRLIYPSVDMDSNIPTKRSFILKEDTEIKITPAHKINDGVFYLQYLDGNKEITPLSDYDDDDWYLTEPHLLVNLDHNNKEDLYYLPFAGTTKSGFKDIDDKNSYDYVHDKNGIVPPSLRTHTITIQQSENQTIRVYYNGIIYTNSFKVESGDNITCSIVPINSDYAAGKLNYTSINNISQDYTISATKATYIVKKKYTITINQTSNQTITVYSRLNDQNYTSTFETIEGDYLSIKISSSTGFISGDITLDGKIYNSFVINNINSNHTISATNATAYGYILSINQSNHQTITVHANGNNYISSVSLPYGTTWTATITPETGYNAGTLSATSGTITGSVTVSATAAAIKTFTLSFGATTNQTYTATIGGSTKAATASATSYTVNYGTKYSVAYTANSATAAYTYTASSAVSGTVTNTTSIPAKTASASLRYYTLSVPATANQSYTLRLATNSSYGGTLPSYTSTATKSSQTLSVPYGTTYSITYTADSGYNPGAAKSGTVNGNTTVSHNAATVATATVTIVQSANQTIHVYTPQKSGGTDHTSTFTCPIGTTYEAEVVAASGYLPGDLSVK